MARKSEASAKERKGRSRAGGNGRRTGGARTNGEGSRSEGPAEHSPVLERGDIFFFYRPDGVEGAPGGLLDVNRFHVVLRPEGHDLLRYLTVGKKKLPGEGGDGRHWAFVDGVFREPEGLRDA